MKLSANRLQIIGLLFAFVLITCFSSCMLKSRNNPVRTSEDSASVLTAPVKPQKKPVAKPEEAPAPRETKGTLSLGYANYSGEVVNGLAHGAGRLKFNSSHQIDSRDSKGRIAEAGDFVEGEFYEGHVVQGIWYGADNQVKGSVIIGK